MYTYRTVAMVVILPMPVDEFGIHRPLGVSLAQLIVGEVLLAKASAAEHAMALSQGTALASPERALRLRSRNTPSAMRLA